MTTMPRLGGLMAAGARRARPAGPGGACARARMLSQQAEKQSYEAPVPVTRNLVLATTLLTFVGGVYYYTVQRIQKNTELGAEFEEIFRDEDEAAKNPKA